MTQDELDTALLDAAGDGDAPRVEELLEQGARIDGVARDGGFQPLHLSIQHGRKEVAKLLLARGARIDAIDGDGWQPLHWAAAVGDREMVGFLLDCGVQIDAANKRGNRAIHYATREGHMEVLELLVMRGADVNAAGASGARPLHEAAQRGQCREKEMEFLISHGADPGAPDNEGKVPHDYTRDEFVRGILEEAAREWPARKEAREREAMSAHLKRQRELGALRPKGPSLWAIP